MRLELENAGLRNDAAARTRALTALARIRPTDPAVWRTLAEAELAARRLPQAAEFYRKSVRFDPQNPATLNTLGYTEALAGNLDGAVDALRLYERLQPDQANPLDSLGDVYFHFGRMAEADEYYRQAFAKAPTGIGGLSLEKAAHARLYVGDIPGADALFNQFLETRKRQGDPAAEYRRAVWLYLSGRKPPGLQAMEAIAREKRIPQLAAQAEAQLAVWYLERDDRVRARQAAEAAAGTGLGAVVRFITEPPASPSEWAVRAERAFTEPAQERIRKFALGYALLLARQFEAAAPLWREIYRQSNPLAPEGSDVLLAWALIDSGRWDGVEELIRANPIPQAAGPGPFASLAFPRILELRARLLEKQGKSDQAAENRRLFQTLSPRS
jgi:tetratricopeptide (TPR) repeat protein